MQRVDLSSILYSSKYFITVPHDSIHHGIQIQKKLSTVYKILIEKLTLMNSPNGLQFFYTL